MLGPWPQRMVNPVRDYEWGSPTVLARMQGRRPAGPEAELWMGAHASAPSGLVQQDGSVTPLDQAIAQHPMGLLGAQVYERFSDRLPYLLKILAIAKPLSVQVHPSPERAAAVFTGDVEGLGGYRYVDAYAKPEMLYALEPTDVLSGFRQPVEVARLLNSLGSERARLLAGLLTATGESAAQLKTLLRTLVTWPQDDRAELVLDLDQAARERLLQGQSSPRDRHALLWLRRLAAQWAADPMVAAPLVLDLRRLDPGQVLFTPAGSPHAYLSGLAVEIMSNSDNVLRAGLTTKTIATEEMLHVVDGDARPEVDVAFRWLSPNEVAWVPPVEDFQLSRIWMTDTAPVAAFPGIAGPQILLCTSGPVQVRTSAASVSLNPGESAFIGASASHVSLVGPGEVFRASAGGQRIPPAA